MTKLIKIKTYGPFVLGSFKKRSDAKPAKEFSEEQIMSALGKSNYFNVRDWFDSVQTVTFTITNIEKDDYDCYTYTIESNKDVCKNYFPSILQICEDYKDVASPISYQVQ